MANVSSSAGTKIYIGPSVVLNTLSVLSEAAAIVNFEAISEVAWVEIGGTESLGEFGDQANQITFAGFGTQRMFKLKGVRDAGTLAIVCGRDAEDEGQIAMEDAEKRPSHYRFRVVLNDEPISPTTFYFAGQVMSRLINVADVNAVTRRAYNVAINTTIYEVPAGAESGDTETATGTAGITLGVATLSASGSIAAGGSVAWSETEMSVGWGVLSDSNRTVTAIVGSGNTGGRTDIGIAVGEKKMVSFTFPAYNAGTAVGIANDSMFWDNSGNQFLGAASGGSYGNHHGLIYTGGTNVASFNSWNGASTVDMEIDRVNDRAWWRVDGGDWNGNPGNDPTTNVGGWDISSINDTFIYPAYSVTDFGGVRSAVTLNAGATPFTYPPSTGFTGMEGGGGGGGGGDELLDEGGDELLDEGGDPIGEDS